MERAASWYLKKVPVVVDAQLDEPGNKKVQTCNPFFLSKTAIMVSFFIID